MSKPTQGVLLVGKKPLMNYVMALALQLQESDQVTVKARGTAISRAVDVVEMTRRRFFRDLEVKDIKIGTEVLGEGEDLRNISTIEILVKRAATKKGPS